MNKCDFCVYGEKGKCGKPFSVYDNDECQKAVERYTRVCLSRNQKTKTYNKNVNVQKKGSRGGKKHW